jgi:maleylacetoacetate isomerase
MSDGYMRMPPNSAPHTPSRLHLQSGITPKGWFCITLGYMLQELGDSKYLVWLLPVFLVSITSASISIMSSNDSRIILHTYFRSSCSARLRIALSLKGLPYESVYVNLLKGEQFGGEYSKINPSHLVPTLQHIKGASDADENQDIVLTQSIAILEYIEEVFPDTVRLLPPLSNTLGRATVRSLANIIACDTQPVTNLRILSRVVKLGGTKEDWAKDLMEEGLAAYETLASTVSGRFSYGDSITLADICLVPAVWGALRFGVDLDKFPVIKRIYEELSQQEAVKQAHWNAQGDTPDSLRA